MRILFTANPVYSHITPMLPLAVTAFRAGHEVVFATGADAVALPKEVGVETVQAGLTLAEARGRYTSAYEPEFLAGLAAEQRLHHLLRHQLAEVAAPAFANDAIAFAQAWKPDLVIGTPAELGGRITASVLGIPHVTHGFGPPDSVAATIIAQGILADQCRRRGSELADSQVYLDIWPAALGAVALSSGARTGMSARAGFFEAVWPLRPDHVVPTLRQRPRPEMLASLPYKRSVYVTLGTTHDRTADVLRKLIEALSSARMNMLVTVGPNGDLKRFGRLPPHIRIESSIPQESVLPYCDAVVCHGGSTTVLGALVHAVPLVVVPMAGDSQLVAEQVEKAGAGVACAAQPLMVGVIRNAFLRIFTEERYRSTTRRIAHELLDLPRPRSVLARLEREFG